MKTSSFVSTLLLSTLLTAGCAKSKDLGKMQEDTIATVKVYIGELDVLQRRYDQLVANRGPSSDANKMLEAAGQAITKARTTAASAPTTVAAAAKSGNPEELTQEHYTIISTLETNIALAKNSLAGYETFITSVAYASSRPAVVPVENEPAPDTGAANDPSSAAQMPPTPPGPASNIPCSAEIALQCPTGQIDACMKAGTNATVHACVPQ
ncbi:MAG: hypothetical protein ACKV2T_18950 [Kofleriaceae bacterium]